MRRAPPQIRKPRPEPVPEPVNIMLDYKIVDNKYLEINIDKYDLTEYSYIELPFRSPRALWTDWVSNGYKICTQY